MRSTQTSESIDTKIEVTEEMVPLESLSTEEMIRMKEYSANKLEI